MDQDFSEALSHEELLLRWPRDEFGQPEEPAFLANHPGGRRPVGSDGRDPAGGLRHSGAAAVSLGRRRGPALSGHRPLGSGPVRPRLRLDEARQLLEAVPEEDAPAP